MRGLASSSACSRTPQSAVPALAPAAETVRLHSKSRFPKTPPFRRLKWFQASPFWAKSEFSLECNEPCDALCGCYVFLFPFASGPTNSSHRTSGHVWHCGRFPWCFLGHRGFHDLGHCGLIFNQATPIRWCPLHEQARPARVITKPSPVAPNSKVDLFRRAVAQRNGRRRSA